MENRLEALMSAYNIKPKKLLKKKKIVKASPTSIKQSSSMNNIKLSSQKALVKKIDPKSVRTQNTNSVQPSQRSNSEFSKFPRERLKSNSSFDDDMTKLENLTVRNSNARLDLVSIQKRMIELGLNYNLNPIIEIDESNNEKNVNLENFQGILGGKKRGSQERTNLKLGSLKDLLVL